MHQYRTHNCNGLRAEDINQEVRLSGWVHRKRDHGGLLFIDLRDHFGLTQLVFDPDSSAFQEAEKVRNESVICLLYTSPSPRDLSTSRMPSSA